MEIPDVVDLHVRSARQFLNSEFANSLGYTDRAERLLQVAGELSARFETLVRQEMADTGKCSHIAREDIKSCIDLWRSAGAHCHTFTSRAVLGSAHDLGGYEFFSAVGVVGIILPWNSPSIVLSERLPFALAAGCSALIKTSETAEGAVRSVVDLTRGVWGGGSVVSGLPRGGPELGRALCEHPAVDMISFTGGTETGREIALACAPTLKKLSLELGGKNSVVVHSDADINLAATSIAESSLINAGQACVQGSRVLIHEDIYDAFLLALAAAYRSHVNRHSIECGVGIQPLVNNSHARRVQKIILEAHERGVSRLDTFSGSNGTWSSPPFVFYDVDKDDRLFQEEIFGPVISVSPYSDIEEAIHLANQGIFGLAAYIWTDSLPVATRIIRSMRAGRIWLNSDARDSITQLSIGGLAASGMGRELGWEGIRTYSNMHSVVSSQTEMGRNHGS